MNPIDFGKADPKKLQALAAPFAQAVSPAVEPAGGPAAFGPMDLAAATFYTLGEAHFHLHLRTLDPGYVYRRPQDSTLRQVFNVTVLSMSPFKNIFDAQTWDQAVRQLDKYLQQRIA